MLAPTEGASPNPTALPPTFSFQSVVPAKDMNYRAKLGALNLDFGAWVRKMATEKPEESWISGMSDYLRAAKCIIDEGKRESPIDSAASTKPKLQVSPNTPSAARSPSGTTAQSKSSPAAKVIARKATRTLPWSCAPSCLCGGPQRMARRHRGALKAWASLFC